MDTPSVNDLRPSLYSSRYDAVSDALEKALALGQILYFAIDNENHCFAAGDELLSCHVLQLVDRIKEAQQAHERLGEVSGDDIDNSNGLRKA